jgi:hypothetical protein
MTMLVTICIAASTAVQGTWWPKTLSLWRDSLRVLCSLVQDTRRGSSTSFRKGATFSVQCGSHTVFLKAHSAANAEVLAMSPPMQCAGTAWVLCVHVHAISINSNTTDMFRQAEAKYAQAKAVFELARLSQNLHQIPHI